MTENKLDCSYFYIFIDDADVNSDCSSSGLSFSTDDQVVNIKQCQRMVASSSLSTSSIKSKGKFFCLKQF